MTHEDKTLQCVECQESFLFSANEQAFYESRQLNSPPRRCRKCRKQNRNRKTGGQPGAGEYRAPAFNDSLTASRNSGRHGRHSDRPNRGDYRSPAFRNEQSDFSAEYRSPAFREYETMDNAEDYRSPAFREYDHIRPEEEYRAPAFREHSTGSPHDEYRSPSFPGQRRNRSTTERPLFEITCVACGTLAMVPFIPEEKEDPMCRDCYRDHQELIRKECEAESSCDTDPEQTP